MKDYPGEIDARVEGLTPLQISRSFVQDNLTKEEMEEDLGETGKKVEEYFHFDHWDKDGVLVGLKKLTDFVMTLSCISSVTLDDGEFEIVGSVNVKVDNIEFYINKWRSQVANKSYWEKEHKEYLRLKNKFEGE